MAALRNFTPEVLEIMAKNIDTNADDYWDYFEDIARFFSVPDVFKDAWRIKEDMDGLNNYLNRYMELNDITHKELLHVLDAVKEVEDRYCKRFKETAAKFRAIRVRLKHRQTELDDMVRRIATLELLYGAGVDFDILDDPEQLARARLDAERKGIPFPLTPEQKAMSEEIYQQLKKIFSDTGIGVGGYNQLDWEALFGKDFAYVACYATCMLMIAQFYGFEVTMQDLIRLGCVTAGALGNTTWPFYAEDRSFGNQGEEANCQKIYEELLQGCPVLVDLGGNGTHFVVAVGIVEGATPPYTYADIIVMDPMAKYTLEKEDKEPSHYWTLEEAMERKKQGVVGIRTTEKGPGPKKEEDAQ